MSFTRVLQRYAPFSALCLATILSVFARVRAGAGALAFYDDDFFYYLNVATHLAAGQGSTFDGIHFTNGYHPLWLLVLTGLARLLPVAMVLNAVMVIVCLSTILTFLLAERCFRQQTLNRWTASLGAAAIAFNTLFLVRGGMEIVLTIPLCLTLCTFRIRPNFRWTGWDATIYGLLAALLVLSRLDSILFVALLFLFEGILLAITPSQKRAPLALTVGILFFVLAAYIVINLHLFPHSLPDLQPGKAASASPHAQCRADHDAAHSLPYFRSASHRLSRPDSDSVCPAAGLAAALSCVVDADPKRTSTLSSCASARAQHP